jgi:ABC-type Zn uptake system ZnuABC Zn-binding protein ZnuA
MKRHTLKLLGWSALTLGGLLPLPGLAAEPLPVVATFSILGDLVQVVGGDRVKVTTLVGPNADAHTFEPKPMHAKAILQSRLFVINGLNFEPWAQKLAKSANFKGQTLIASQGIAPRSMPPDKGHAHADTDPHAWQFRFLAPQGINADAEPSAKEVAQLIRQIKRDQIKAVFVENMSNPKLLAQITRDTGVTMGPKLYVDALSGPNEPGSSYLKMMHHNVTQLVAGMQLNASK